MTNQPALNLSISDPAHAPRIFDLEQPRTDTMPIHPSHRPGYSYVLHRRHQDAAGQDGPRSSASGMIVCMEHTGNEHAWGDQERYLAGPGMAGDASRWLADQGVVAVGADNMAWDVIGLRDPEFGCTLPGHLLLLAQRGIYIIENMRLSELAAAQVYRFMFVCTALKFVGATGSPVRPVALAPA